MFQITRSAIIETAMNTREVTVGVVLASAALSCASLTIGPVRGAAWIGQPLELSVPVQLEMGTGAVALCAGADIFYADSQQDLGRVQVLQEPTEQADIVRLRVVSSAAVDEPVVTVNLRVGCEQKFTRRYVLLADLPNLADTVVPGVSADVILAPVAATAVETAAMRMPTPVARTRLSTGAGDDATKATPTAPKPRTARSAPPKVRQGTATPAVKAPGPQGSRLKLDPLEVLTERVKTLESTTTAVPLEDMVKDSGRVQQLQKDVQTLLTQAAKNDANLVALRERLEKAESERASNLLAYGLAALALLCAVAIAWIWSRRREPLGWHSELHSEPASSHYESRGGDTIIAGALKAVKPGPAQTPPTPAKQKASLDVNLIEMDEWDWPKTGKGRLGGQ